MQRVEGVTDHSLFEDEQKIVEGLTAREIADRLGVSIHTTDTHTRHVFKKLGVHSRAAAVARAMRENLV